MDSVSNQLHSRVPGGVTHSSVGGSHEDDCRQTEKAGKPSASGPGSDPATDADFFKSGVAANEERLYNQRGEVVLYRSRWLKAVLLKGIDHGYGCFVAHAKEQCSVCTGFEHLH